MKSTIFSIGFTLFTLVSVFANAVEPIIIPESDKTFIVDASSLKIGDINVLIYDNDGHQLLNMSQQANAKRKYNLEKLESGAYTVRVIGEYKEFTHHLTIDQNGLLLDTKTDIVFKPQFNIADDHIDINFLSVDDHTRISIESPNGSIYTTDINEKSINKRLNIAQLPKGRYTIIVSNEENVFTKSFKK